MILTYIIIFFNILVYSFGILVIFKNGGVKNNLTFSFTWMLFIIYYFLTPLYFYSNNRKTIWGDEGTNYGVGVNIIDYYDEGFLYYGFANFLLLIGYITYKSRKKIKVTNSIYIDKSKIKYALIIAFSICFSLVTYNFVSEGINFVNLFFGSKDDTIAGITGASNYLKNFSDSIIAILICSYFYKLKNIYLIPMIVFSFLLFVLLGFRYRIILTLIGFFLIYIHRSNFDFYKIFKFIPVVFIFFYSMLFITYNRFTFARGAWDELIYNPKEFEYSIIFEQTRGMLDDITIIKYYDTNNSPKYDYGVSFIYFFVRILPRSIVGNEFKDSLYPPPAFPIIEEAYDVIKVWGKDNTGEAPLHLSYFIISFGLYGLYFFSFLGGLFIKYFKNKFSDGTDKSLLIQVLFTSALFQWITRGYFPGFVDHLGFMLLGLYMIRKIYNFQVKSFQKI